MEMLKNFQYNNITIGQYNNRKKGFSLIEVAATVAILVLIVSGMLGIFWQGFVATKASKGRMVAYSLAREMLERNFVSPFPSTTTDSVTLNDVTYNRTLTVSDGPVFPTQLKQLDVTVSWDTESFTLTTLKANY